MKLLIIFGLVFTFTKCGDGFRHFRLGQTNEKGNLNNLSKNENFTTKWFTQKLDHSDPTNHQTWQQRYFVNEQYFNEANRSVAFLFIGGESAASTDFMSQGAWIEYAQQFEALAVQVEHRFYGKSQPTGDATIESYRYFTSEQALGDLANIIQSVDVKFRHGPQWIVFGGSYAGSLAAWLRLKYPHLIKGSINTSGPLLAKLDFYEYYQVVAQDLKDISDECYYNVQNGSSHIEELIESSAGRETLSNLFKLCTPLDDNRKNILNFLDSVHSNFAGVAQYNKDNRISATEKRRNFTLDSVCKIITDKSENRSNVEKLADFSNVMLNFDAEDCLDISYIEMVKYLNDSTDTSNNGRAWFFQTCNEFGWYQSPHKADIFGSINLADFYIEQCQEVFGSTFNKTTIESNILRTNTIYGGWSNILDKVVHVQGSVDPWHKMGIVQSSNILSPAIFINGTAHCADLYPSGANDPPQLVDARNQIKHLIQQWLY